MQINAASPTWVTSRTVGESAGLLPASAAVRILIVNEDWRSADSLKRTLQELGYTRILTAYSAKRALVTAAEFCPSVALLDLDLPDMTGYQLAGKFRAHLLERVRGVPLLAVAEQPASEYVDHIQAAGFIGCVTKPVAAVELNALLRRLHRLDH